MKKGSILLLAIFVLVQLTFAQSNKSKTPPPAPRPAPKGPPPYVLKKEYEPQMAEMNAKINAASGAANAARRNMDGFSDKITLLDSQMNTVQAILSSANFQIALNADSLATTRSTIDDLSQKTNEQFNTIQLSQASLSQNIWIVFGVLLAVSIAVFAILMNMINKRMAQLKVMLHMNEEVLKKSLSTSQEKQQKELKEELQSLESRSLFELTTIKKEISQQISSEKVASAAALQALSEKVELLQEKKETGDADPEVFI
jgi:hypothetical protein